MPFHLRANEGNPWRFHWRRLRDRHVRKASELKAARKPDGKWNRQADAAEFTAFTRHV